MKKFRKLFALLVAAALVVAMSMTTFAAGKLTVSNATYGQTYTAYKIFNAVYENANNTNKVTYTVPAAKEQYVTTPFSLSSAKASNGEKIVLLAADTSDADVVTWVKNNYSNFDSTGVELPYDAATGTAHKDDLDYGYYYVTSGLGALITIDSVNNDVSVVDKNESQPDGPTKVITAEDSSIDTALDQTGVSLETNDAAVGSVETYKVTFNAVNWVQVADENPGAGTPDNNTKVTVWNFEDVAVGLTIDASTVAVTVNGTDVTSTLTNKAVDNNGKLSFNIPWVNANGASLYDAKTAESALIPVVVTYNATVADAAATAVATNTVTVKYNTDQTLGTKTTTTKTYKFKLKKTDASGGALDGAEFQLFYGTSTTPLTFKMNDGKYQYDPAGTITNIAPVKGNGTEAIAEVIGLDNASYTLKEVVVPSGYTAAADKPVSGLTAVDATGDPTTITVENIVGVALPSTGGIGTTIFYILGSILVIGAGVLLVTKRRMDS